MSKQGSDENACHNASREHSCGHFQAPRHFKNKERHGQGAANDRYAKGRHSGERGQVCVQRKLDNGNCKYKSIEFPDQGPDEQKGKEESPPENPRQVKLGRHTALV